MSVPEPSLGIDVGSVTLKLALLDGADSLLYSTYEKHHSRPMPVLLSALKQLREKMDLQRLSSVAVTGSGRNLVSEWLEFPSVNEIVAQSVAVSRFCPGTKTILEIGGQDSKFIQLGDRDASGKAIMLTQKMNDICAAGTGAFVEQQAERMSIPIESFGDKALASADPAFVAGRCAVFAKTDIIHLRQEGMSQADIAAGICNAVVRNYLAQFAKGARLETPIVFQGGLAANKGVVKAFRDSLGVSEDELRVPEHFNVMAAMGTAIMSRDHAGRVEWTIDEIIENLESCLESHRPEEKTVSTLAGLVKKTHRLKVFPDVPSKGRERAFVGIDVGSTSTCVAVLSSDDRLLASNYTFNKSNVIESVNAALEGIRVSLSDRLDEIEIAGAGVTGSGRHLVARYIGADVVKDEISAQARAAVHMLPDADTVFEIGGQDSKYIRLSEGRVVDFEMNKVCAAGTGSFLQEQAARLHEDIGDLSDIAFQSKRPVDLGSRCTVFMESDLVNYQQMGFPKEDLIAGLSYSIVRNYLDKVVVGRKIGDRILILGGVAYNESVVAAFQQILEKDLIVPDHHEISAAIGMALIVREELATRSDHVTGFRGFGSRDETYELSSFQCKDCSNTCRINTVRTADTLYNFGGACGKHENRKRKRQLPDLFARREEILMSYHRPDTDSSREKIGIPRAQLFYEHFPFQAVFLHELGFEVVVSDRTNRQILQDGIERTSLDNCLPSKVVYGHIHNLVEKGVRRIFMPTFVEFERRVKDREHNFACPHVQSLPLLIRMAFPETEIISPFFMRYRSDREWLRELERVGRELGRPAGTVRRAVRRAAEAQAEFQRRCEDLGSAFLAELTPGEPVAVVMGKTYNVCDPALNLNVVEKLMDLDVVPLPFDCLPLSKQPLPENYQEMTFQTGLDLARAARVILEYPDLRPVLITNFQCTPDSFIMKFLDELFRTKSYLILEMDEHTSDIGIMTRLEAFLNNIRGGSSDFESLSLAFKPFIVTGSLKKIDRIVYVSSAYRSYRAIAAALESIGIRSKCLPVHDRKTHELGCRYSSGKECNPYIMEVGSAVRMTMDPEFHPDKAAILVPSSDIGCRIAFMGTGLRLVLGELGYPNVPVIAPKISMETDEIYKLFGAKFLRETCRGILAIELLIRLLTETRPYETVEGEADRAFELGVDEICRGAAGGRFWKGLDGAVERFDRIERSAGETRPIIGLFGDDYTRDNQFANNGLVKEIEAMGGEVQNVSVWSGYLQFQMGAKPRNTVKKHRYGELPVDLGKWVIGAIDGSRVARRFEGRLRSFPTDGFASMMDAASRHVDRRTDPVIIIAVARILDLIYSRVDGMVNVVGFQCALYTIMSAILKKLCVDHDSLPNLTLFFDFQEKIHHRNRLEAFMHQVRQYREHRRSTRSRSAIA